MATEEQDLDPPSLRRRPERGQDENVVDEIISVEYVECCPSRADGYGRVKNIDRI
jgi:hypothetical protein